MALGIPLPSADFGGQLASGSQNLMNQMIMQHLNSKKMAQQQTQFEQELALKKQAAGRAGANSDLTRSIMQQQLLGLQHKNDPNYGFNQYMALEQMIKGQGNQNQNMPQDSMPKQEVGEGLGIFTTQGMAENQEQGAQNAPSTAEATGTGGAATGGFDLQLLKTHPALRGLAKNLLGYDPLAQIPQTPQEKQTDALNLFKQKEAIKAKADDKSGNIATNKVLTQNQQALQAIDTVMPMLDEFINDESKVYGRTDFDPSKKAAYNAKTGGMIDLLVAAQSLPQVKESVALVESQIRRQNNEETKAYIKRLKDFKTDMAARRVKSKRVIDTKRVDTGSAEDMTGMSDDELRKIAGGG